ncbi:imidazolonepropionase [Vampirovibrio sp.]|uniref:imidazolonepropionase n=1 Tax=Vampirovibrio sp. TaxID=2717857 RepID=UPI0035936805
MSQISRLIYNIGQLVTVDPGRMTVENPLGVIENGAILFEQGKIAWLGASGEINRVDYPNAQWIDARGRVMLPGLIDSHTHTIFAGDRANEFEMRLQGKSYQEIAQAGGGILKTVQATRNASAEELSALTLQRLHGMLAFGVTTVEIKSGYGLDFNSEMKCLRVLKALRTQAPVSMVTTYMGAHDIPPEYQGLTEAYVDLLCQEQIPVVAEERLADFCDVFCEKGYFDVPQSRRILETAHRYGLKLKIHAEEFCDWGGAKLAGELEAVSADHLLHISDEGIAALKAGGTVATLLPGTAFYLRIQEYAPALKLITAGVPVALATDFNPGSCMIDNLQFIMALACLQMNMPPVEVIKAVTLHAAKALDLQHDRGSLTVGKRADAALFDRRSYNELLYRVGSNALSDVYVAGQHYSRQHLEVPLQPCV